MNLEQAFDNQLFVKEESFQDICNFKEDCLDRTSHQLMGDYQGHASSQYEQTFLQSPKRPSSFFFTPTSPRHFQLEINHTADEFYTRTSRPNFNLPNNVPSISQKLNLKEEEDDIQMVEECQSLGESQCLQNKRSSPNRSSKNAKGLKNLSESVYMIVSDLAKTRYKQVADRLVNDISQDTIAEFDKNKDEHNVKRRVYDALNVLIAAGILKKEGKQVVCNEPYRRGNVKSNKSIKNTRQMLQKIQLQSELKKKLDAIKQKKQKLAKMEHKKNQIASVIIRNKQQNLSFNDILRFPLIASVIEEGSASIQEVTDHGLTLKLKERPVLCGDVDMLMQIDLSSVKNQNFIENVYSLVKEEEYLKIES